MEVEAKRKFVLKFPEGHSLVLTSSVAHELFRGTSTHVTVLGRETFQVQEEVGGR